MLFAGKTVIVTGAGRGIGRAIAIAFAQEGANVAVASKTMENAEATCAAIREIDTNLSCHPIQVDVTSEESVKQMVATTTSQFETGIDVLVNNAGMTRDGLMMTTKVEDWDLVLNTNLRGPALCTKAVIPKMRKQPGTKSIINIGSVVGGHGNPGQGSYCASKAGLSGLTKALAKELAGQNINVNLVVPGLITTDMTDALTDEQRNKAISQIPLNRPGLPEEVAQMVLLLAKATYTTGAEIPVDGGMGM